METVADDYLSIIDKLALRDSADSQHMTYDLFHGDFFGRPSWIVSMKMKNGSRDWAYRFDAYRDARAFFDNITLPF